MPDNPSVQPSELVITALTPVTEDLPSNDEMLAFAAETREEFYRKTKVAVDNLFKTDPKLFEDYAKRRGYTLGEEFQKQINHQKSLLGVK